MESRFPHRFGETDIGLLWRGIKGFVCGGGDVSRYVGIGVTLDQAIMARRSSRRLFTIILEGHVLTIYIYIYLAYCVLILDRKSKNKHKDIKE